MHIFANNGAFHDRRVLIVYGDYLIANKYSIRDIWKNRIVNNARNMDTTVYYVY